MKKSEMLYQIIALLVITKNKDLGYSDTAQEILGLIEDRGMLPPVVPGKYDPVPTITPTGNHEYSWIREWESE